MTEVYIAVKELLECIEKKPRVLTWRELDRVRSAIQLLNELINESNIKRDVDHKLQLGNPNLYKS